MLTNAFLTSVFVPSRSHLRFVGSFVGLRISSGPFCWDSGLLVALRVCFPPSVRPGNVLESFPMATKLDFHDQHFDNWSLSMICQNMLLSLYHLTTFTFTQLPNWFLTSSWHCVRQRLQKGKVFTTLIFCLLESLIYLPISLSLLETGQRNSRFLFLLSKLEKGIQVSLSPLETGQENSRFLFLLSRRGKGIRISLSPLECGEIVF